MERRSEHPRKRGAEILAAQLCSHALLFNVGIISTHLENISIITKQYFFPSALFNSIKSI